MKRLQASRNMKPNSFSIIATLTFFGLLGMVSSSLAEEGKWEQKADMLFPRDRHPSSVVNGKIYVIGGGHWAEEPKSFSTVQEYDPATNTWSRKADMPTARLALSTGVVDGIIYAIGGWPIRNRTEAYNPSTDTWSRKADMPTSRFTPAIGVVDGIIYVIGCRG